jgi:nucleoid-associated protein YgaU
MTASFTSMMSPTGMLTRPQSLGGVPSNQQRAKIVTVDSQGIPLPKSSERYVELEFQFNPATIQVTKSVSWTSKSSTRSGGRVQPQSQRNAPDLDFGGGQPATFQLDFTFDTSQEGEDVRGYTQELLKLVMMGKQHGSLRLPPPRVQFQWGSFVLFMAVVEKVTITYSLFLPDGTPVRATAKVDFKQHDDTDDKRKGQNPTTRTEARKTRIVQAGDRLDLIAYEEYGHAAHWRFLAEANGLLDPRALQPGQILAIPALP